MREPGIGQSSSLLLNYSAPISRGFIAFALLKLYFPGKRIFLASSFARVAACTLTELFMLRARMREYNPRARRCSLLYDILPTKVQISPRRVAFRIVIQMDRHPRQPTTTDDAVEYFSRFSSRLPRSDRSWRAGGRGYLRPGDRIERYRVAAVTRTLFHPHSGGRSRATRNATRPTAEERLLARQFAD